ncbi:hypothetical protein T11_15574 [Trichinella zimbabwensis]|uniref:Uncharacterized protein n=1 Tax=Trichinella zimbabwensis TaxID=268475 RepID=A0A0V1HD86_9BILA|nr:hypothetical protein T11_15574 [Trichinella zimbabwensis]
MSRFHLFQCRSTSSGKGSSQDTLSCQRDWNGILAITVNGAKQPTGSNTRDAVLSSWRLESCPSWRVVPGDMNVRQSSLRSQKIPNVFQRQPSVPAAHLSAGIKPSAVGSLLAHLCKWNPLAAINSSS